MSESDYISQFNKSNDYNNKHINNKNIPFKNSANYANNNIINNELEKMMENMSKYSGNPNNSKYIPKKTIYRKQFNEIYPSNSYREIQIYSDPNLEENDNLINNYLDEDYDFYKNEKDHVKKVQDKIFQMKIQRQDEISKECTFTPTINEVPKYLFENKSGENNLTDINRSYANNYNNHMYNFNHNGFNNSYNNSRSFSKKRRNHLNDEYSDNYYNVYPQKLSKKKNHSKEPHSFSNSKRKNPKDNDEYSIYKNRKQELLNEYKKQYPFMPTIQENKKFQVKSTFDERQKKFIEEKIKYRKDKEKEKQEEIEEMKRYYNKSKANIKELIKKLYDEEAEKIKEQLKKEKEEKSKKKKVIDWDKRIKEIKEKYPNAYKSNTNLKSHSRKKNKDEIDINSIKDKEINIELKDIIKSNSKEKEKGLNKNKKNSSKNIKKKKDLSLNKKDKKHTLIDKIKDEHVIGFKNNITTKNSNKFKKEKDELINSDQKYENNINLVSGDLKDISMSLNLDNDSNLKTSINLTKKSENDNLLEGLNKKGGLKSNTLHEMMDRLHKK